MAPKQGVVATIKRKLGEKSAKNKAVKAWIKENHLKRDTERKDKFWIDRGHSNYIIVEVNDPAARDAATAKILEFRHDISVGSVDEDDDKAERLAERKVKRLKMEKKKGKDEEPEPGKPSGARARTVAEKLIGTPKKKTENRARARAGQK